MFTWRLKTRMEFDIEASVSITAEEEIGLLQEEGTTLNQSSVKLLTYAGESSSSVDGSESRALRTSRHPSTDCDKRSRAIPFGTRLTLGTQVKLERFSQYTLSPLYKMCWMHILKYSKMDSEWSNESLPRLTFIRMPLHSSTER